MPRQPRIDFPGVVQHVVCRGIEKRTIFADDSDRRDYLDRLASVLLESRTRCFAWALLPNHLHLLVCTRDVALSKAMARINTGYATSFNRRHERVGYLFQNRFFSRIVEDDFLTALAYVAGNPLRHRVVTNEEELARHPWSAYGALTGTQEPEEFHACTDALLRVASEEKEARRRLREAMQGRWKPARRCGNSDEAIAMLVERVCSDLGIRSADLASGARGASYAAARRAIARTARTDGWTLGQLAKRLGVSHQALSKTLRSRPHQVAE